MEINLGTAAPPSRKYFLRLYIAEGTPRSTLALRNLTKLCDKHLPGLYEIEVIDLKKDPERAKEDQILAVPTLVRKLPTPIRKFIGNLAHPEQLLVDFDLRPNEPELFPQDAAPAESQNGETHV